MLKGAESALTTYNAISNHPIGGPILDAIDVVTTFTPTGLGKNLIKTGIKVVAKTAVKKQGRVFALKNLFRVVKGSLSNLTKFAVQAGKLLTKFNPETGWFIYNMARDIESLLTEKDDCLRAGLWGKLFYKVLRLAKSVFFGTGFMAVAQAGAKIQNEEELDQMVEAMADAGNLFS